MQSVRRRTWAKSSKKPSEATTSAPTSGPSARRTKTKGLTPAEIAKSGTEHGEQAALFFWAALNKARWPVLRWLYAIPNGGGRSPVEGSRLKAEGVKKGVSDVCLPVPMWKGKAEPSKTHYNGIYIEMKRKDGTIKDVKPEQGEFLEFVQSQGYYGCVCFGWEQASKTLEWYLDESN
jgi:hypothetical protein